MIFGAAWVLWVHCPDLAAESSVMLLTIVLRLIFIMQLRLLWFPVIATSSGSAAAYVKKESPTAASQVSSKLPPQLALSAVAILSVPASFICCFIQLTLIFSAINSLRKKKNILF